ncbi:MAG: hypothetical protein QOC71_2066 [Thermoplasmata archaeon]|nr:hypothetical protein [Thermoplasmata archaeon]
MAPQALVQSLPRSRAYTVDDNPANLARIEGDLARVLEVVRQGDPGLRSLVLTGGFARGVGAMMGGAPQNDYDFVAFRGLRRPRVPYAAMAGHLEDELGLHIDLAPVAAARIPLLASSIFWYETALRGRVLWGEDLLARIHARSPDDLDPAEGLRLLVNRAAGLLLVTARPIDEAGAPHAYRIQASKGLLAALDAHLLALGHFAPSQTERWQAVQALLGTGLLPAELERGFAWSEWAFRFKVDPSNAPPRDAREAWAAARLAILAAVPAALRHAGLPDLDSYARRDRLLDRAVYWHRSAGIPQARRLAAHPTGQVRVATLRLLAGSADGHVRPEAAQACLEPVARSASEPLRLLDGLRRATLQ